MTVLRLEFTRRMMVVSILGLSVLLLLVFALGVVVGRLADAGSPPHAADAVDAPPHAAPASPAASAAR